MSSLDRIILLHDPLLLSVPNWPRLLSFAVIGEGAAVLDLACIASLPRGLCRERPSPPASSFVRAYKVRSDTTRVRLVSARLRIKATFGNNERKSPSPPSHFPFFSSLVSCHVGASTHPFPRSIPFLLFFFTIPFLFLRPYVPASVVRFPICSLGSCANSTYVPRSPFNSFLTIQIPPSHSSDPPVFFFPPSSLSPPRPSFP